MTKEEIKFLDQLEEIRKWNPSFGYQGKVGYIQDGDDVVNWDEVIQEDNDN